MSSQAQCGINEAINFLEKCESCMKRKKTTTSMRVMGDRATKGA